MIQYQGKQFLGPYNSMEYFTVPLDTFGKWLTFSPLLRFTQNTFACPVQMIQYHTKFTETPSFSLL